MGKLKSNVNLSALETVTFLNSYDSEMSTTLGVGNKGVHCTEFKNKLKLVYFYLSPYTCKSKQYQ